MLVYIVYKNCKFIKLIFTFQNYLFRIEGYIPPKSADFMSLKFFNTNIGKQTGEAIGNQKWLILKQSF